MATDDGGGLASALLSAGRPKLLPCSVGAAERDVRVYWGAIERCSSLRLLDAYQPLLAEPEHYIASLYDAAALLFKSGYTAHALDLWTRLAEHWRRTNDVKRLIPALGGLAIALWDEGRLQEAMDVWREQEGHYTATGNRLVLCQRAFGLSKRVPSVL